MGFRIAVCDDEPRDAAYVMSLLQKWASLRQIDISLASFPSAQAFLFRYAEQKDYDMVLLDIEMPGMNGVEMAKVLRRENKTVEIIFVTGFSDYIAEGYEVAALHYLMKPVSESKLFQVLDRAAEKRLQNERYLNLLLSGEMVRIALFDIDYLDVHQNYVTVHALEDYTVKKTLGDFERELDERFFRVGRGMIVNLDAIRRTTRTDVYLRGGIVLPLPRGAYEPLNRAIIART